jgi:hypothetical protein
MATREHRKITKRFRGVDYYSNDLDRNEEFFKDSKNLQLSSHGIITGRPGYRQIFGGMHGFSSAHRHVAVNPLTGEAEEELILNNGLLWRLAQGQFSWTENYLADLKYDNNYLYVSNDNPTWGKIPQPILTIGQASIELYRFSLGSLWEQLKASSLTLTLPKSSSFCAWAKLKNRTSTLNGIYETWNFENDGLSLGNSSVEVNDRLMIPGVQSSAWSGVAIAITKSGGSLQLYRSKGSGAANKIAPGWIGIAALGAQCITRVGEDGKTVFFSYPEPIDTPAFFAGVVPIPEVSPHHFMTPTPTGGIRTGTYETAFIADQPPADVEYKTINVADSTFFFCNYDPKVVP